MTLEEQLIEQYRSQGVFSGGELYLNPQVALQVVVHCSEVDLAVVGVEGFSLKDNRLIPQLDTIADWSSLSARTWQEFRMACNRETKNFLMNLPGDIVVNLALLSENEWR